MAVYKVIQDIEAEDKLLGPLSLKGFIYAIIAAVLGYVGFRISLASQLGSVRWLIIFLLLFPILLFAVLASPLGREQPTEVWLLSRIRFFLQSRKRIWNQAGISDLVTITAPKRPDRILTKNLSQREVRSRLKALATTLDSRGWAVKNVTVNLTDHPDYLDSTGATSERLIDTTNLPQMQPEVDVHASDDIMDEKSNATAQHFEALMQQADTDRKKEIIEKVQAASKEESESDKTTDFQFLDRLPPSVDETGNTIFVGRKIIDPATKAIVNNDSFDEIDDEPSPRINDGMNEEERRFLEEKHKLAEAIHAAAPKSVSRLPKSAQIKKNAPKQPAVTEVVQTAKLKELSEVAKDDKLTTLAKMASLKNGQIKQIGPNEVEIDLH